MVQRKPMFKFYVADLISNVTLDNNIKFALVCVLLLHFDSIKADFPEHILITRMVSCQKAGINRLAYWSQQIISDFQRLNGSSLPESKGDLVVPITEMAEITEAMRDYEKHIYELQQQVTVTLMQQLECNSR